MVVFILIFLCPHFFSLTKLYAQDNNKYNITLENEFKEFLEKNNEYTSNSEQSLHNRRSLLIELMNSESNFRISEFNRILSDETKKLAKYTWLLQLYTLILCTAAIAQALLFWWQLRMIRATAEDTSVSAGAARESALAARDSLELSKENSIRELRAYISMTPKLVYNYRTSGNIGVSFEMKNHGKTPAYSINHYFSILVLENIDTNYPSISDLRFSINDNVTLFPGLDVPVHMYDNKNISDEKVNEVESNQSRVHIIGRTEYVDAFERKRITTFSASFGGRAFAESMAQRDNGGRPGWNWVYGRDHNSGT